MKIEQNVQDIAIELMEVDAERVNRYMDKLPEEKKQRIAKGLRRANTGIFAVAPIICRGPDKCPFIRHCPIPEVIDGEVDYGPLQDYPISEPCILEATFIKQKTIEYLNFLEVDSNNPIELSIVNELALIDLYKNRAVMILSSGDRNSQGMDFLRIDVTEMSGNGNGEGKDMSASTTQVHPVLAVIDQLEKRRTGLLDRLLATRKAQSDLAIKMGKRKESSQLMQEIAVLRDMMSNLQVPAKTTDRKQIPLKD